MPRGRKNRIMFASRVLWEAELMAVPQRQWFSDLPCLFWNCDNFRFVRGLAIAEAKGIREGEKIKNSGFRRCCFCSFGCNVMCVVSQDAFTA